MPSLGSTAIGGILTITTSYILGDSARPSEDKKGILRKDEKNRPKNSSDSDISSNGSIS